MVEDSFFSSPRKSEIQYKKKQIRYSNHDATIDYLLIAAPALDKYHATAKLFYKNADVIGLVYSINCRNSFQELKDYWFESVLDICPKDVLVVLIGNQNDLYEQEEVDENDAKDFAKSNNIGFFKISAKTNQGINELFEYIGDSLLPKKIIENKSTVTLTSCNVSNKKKKVSFCK